MWSLPEHWQAHNPQSATANKLADFIIGNRRGSSSGWGLSLLKQKTCIVSLVTRPYPSAGIPVSSWKIAHRVFEQRGCIQAGLFVFTFTLDAHRSWCCDKTKKNKVFFHHMTKCKCFKIMPRFKFCFILSYAGKQSFYGSTIYTAVSNSRRAAF